MRHRQKYCLMTIPYRIRRGLQRFLIILGVLSVICLAALIAWILWLSRYVVYTDEGAKLDFGHVFDPSAGVLAQSPTTRPSVPITYADPDDLDSQPSTALTQMEGYHITAEMLTTKSLSQTQAALEALPVGSTILLDVKNVRGEFFYDSQLGRNPSNMDAAAVSTLIQDLQKKDCYLIARFPAFRDFHYFIDDQTTRVPYGLPKKGGSGALWEDKSIKNNLHYWFNPASNGALNYVVQIVTELRSLGFDEVVFSDFRFPDTNDIAFSGDKTAALNQAAKTLVQACGTDSFTISFTGTHFTLPEGRCRVYLENVPAADIASVLSDLTLENPAAQVVFLTELLDTRYEAYSVLRPLEVAGD